MGVVRRARRFLQATRCLTWLVGWCSPRLARAIRVRRLRPLHGARRVGAGSIAGAAIGVWANAASLTQPLSPCSWQRAGSFLGLCICAIGLKNFSFIDTIKGVIKVVDIRPINIEEASRVTLEQACSAIANRASLTPREVREVFEMLARGRDSFYIQERLTVSRNTVKAHVKHIYAKLDIHTHQELLDIVELGDGVVKSHDSLHL